MLTPGEESVTLVGVEGEKKLNSQLISGRFLSSMIKGLAVAYFLVNY